MQVPNYALPNGCVREDIGSKNSYCEVYTREYNGDKIFVCICPDFALKSLRIESCSQPMLSPEKMVSLMDTKPDLVLNGGFFATSTGASIWNLKSNGVVLSRQKPNEDCGFGVLDDGFVTNGPFEFGNDWRDYVTTYPDLIRDGLSVSFSAADINYKACRTCIGWTECIDNPKVNRTYFFVVSQAKVSLDELQRIMLDIFPTVEYCGNLDGGGSSYMLFDGRRKNPDPSVSWIRPVDNIVVVDFKSDQEIEDELKEPEVIYLTRYVVQLGAWGKRSYAYNFLQEIQELSTEVHDYSDAYVTFVDPYYKVQCGSFASKSNAERMRDDLKSHGYDCFVTTKQVAEK